MASQNPQQRDSPTGISKLNLLRFWPLLFGLFGLQIFIAIVAIIVSPSDLENQFLLGLSRNRLFIVIGLAGLAGVNFYCAFFTARNKTWRDEFLNPVNHPRLWDMILGVSLIGTASIQLLLIILRGLSLHGQIFSYGALVNRLAPILNCFTLCGVELLIWIKLLRSPDLKQFRALARLTVWIWALLGGVTAFILITQTGLTPDWVGSFGLPAVPLLEWQLLLAWIAGIVVMQVEPKAREIQRLDVWVGSGIWLATSILWMSQPVNPAYFATPPRPPAYQIFPFSDALNYALEAQSILIGNGMHGFFGGIPPRPFYIELLAWFHALAGQNYSHVIGVQTILLACFPAALYFLGKEIGGRHLGFSTALLAILRDVTSNQMAPISDNITYSKLFFSELPVALLLVFFLWLVIRWMKNPTRSGVQPAIAGGVLGLAMLIRTQCVIFLPAAFLLGLILYKNRMRIWIGHFLVLCLVFSLTIAPWLWRNYRLTGGIIFDHPATQTMVLAQRYNDGQPIPQLKDESLSQYSNRLMRITVAAMVNRPNETVGYIADHFLNNLIDNLLIFPVRSDLPGLKDLLIPSQPFWQDLPSSFRAPRIMFAMFFLMVFGVGVAAAAQRYKWIGIFPLICGLAYHLWTSIFRSSGGRFLVPVDWVFYMYGALGLLTISLVVSQLFSLGNKRNYGEYLEMAPQAPSIPASLRSPIALGSVVVGLGFFCLGFSLPASEWVVQDRYPVTEQVNLMKRLTDADTLARSGVQTSQMESILNHEDLVLVQGRAVYPRYYYAGEGEPKTAKIGYEPSARARLLFYLLSKDVNNLVILYTEIVPADFPHPADAILLGVDKGEYFEAYLVLVENHYGDVVYLSQISIP